jgi:large conductance mechanosensitive channel
MLKDFISFIRRGNVVELAVAVVIGVAFGAVVASFVEGLLTPLIAAAGGRPDFSALTFEINESTFGYGQFVNAVVAFLVVAAAVYFLVVRPVNAMVERSRTEPPPDPTVKKCPECLSDIPAEASRCAYCTSSV